MQISFVYDMAGYFKSGFLGIIFIYNSTGRTLFNKIEIWP